MLSFLKRGGGPRGMTCIGLEPQGFALTHVTYRDDRPYLAVCDYRPVEDTSSLEHEIAQALRDYGLRGTPGVALLDPSAYALRLVDAPDVGEEFMKEAVRYSIADLIDFDVDEAVIDLFQIPGQSDQGRGQNLYVVAARAAEIEQTADMLNDAGLRLQSIRIQELALRNLAARTPEDRNGLALVHLNRYGGMITVTCEQQLFMTRYTEVGLGTFLEAAPLELDDEKPALTEDAEELFETLLLEIQRSLDYYEHQLGQPRANHVTITPLERDIPGLQEYLTQNLSVNVRAIQLDDLIDTDHEIARDLQTRCLTTIGGALRLETT